MNNIIDLCFLCTKEYNCVPVDHKIVTQVEYVLPEITIFSLGIPLRICSTCYDSLYSFGKFKQSSVESSRRFEANIKAQNSSPNTDNLKHKPQHGSSTEQQMAQTSLHTDSTSPMEVFIKEEKMDETNQDQLCYNNSAQNSSQLGCTKNCSMSDFNKFKETDEKRNQEMAARDPLLQDYKTDNSEHSNTNLEKIEEVFIKEEQLDEPCENMEYYSSMLQQDCVTNNIDGSSRAETNNEDWEGSSANCEGETGKKTEAGIITSLTMLPDISRKKYELAYKLFLDWRKSEEMTSFSENVLVAYFDKLSKQYKASTLWTQYSMLRTTLIINKIVDIAKYTKLRAFLKRESWGYKPKKGKTFTTSEIFKFIEEAPDIEYLLTKVALIMGIMGACRRHELYSMKTTDFHDTGASVEVRIPDTKTKSVRKFTIIGKFYVLFKKYANLRPSHAIDPSFFINYQKGKCTSQKVGINKFGAMGKKIAKYLNLTNPELYTGHCFRRSSATILVDPEGQDIK